MLDTYDEDGTRFLATYGVGPHLPYFGFVHAQGRGIAGVQVEARRVGGIEASPPVVTSTSDANGIFSLTGFVPRSTGNLLVDLIFRPPAPYAAFIIRGVSLQAIDQDSGPRFIAIWDVDGTNPPFP